MSLEPLLTNPLELRDMNMDRRSVPRWIPREVDSAIERLQEGPYVDDLQLRRLKKRKLQLKDFIAQLESRLIPDIDA